VFFRPGEEDQLPSYTLTFNIEFPHDNDQVYLAHCYPYTYTDLQDYLIQLQVSLCVFLLHSIVVQGGADKSLAQPTSRCRRMESIVSLERVVCSCAKLQVSSCYRGWKRSPFFVRCGGQCCRGDLVGRTTFWIFFEWLAKVRAMG